MGKGELGKICAYNMRTAPTMMTVVEQIKHRVLCKKYVQYKSEQVA